MPAKLKKIDNSNQTTITKHCQAEINLWKQIDGKDIGNTLTSYYNLTVHLFCELGEARAKLARMGKK
ncbi:hypothetical protein [Acinetobacter baumannii]|uniref:hypothetical protein n=1 Tax=Acinetobacter baumannii TaxID=470 RepID=UPI0002BB282D|nr:hypothetical protein [Acinetobacter baumannii]RSP34233.1 hypothetical protein EA732_09675 [Acinetobacter baumannii]